MINQRNVRWFEKKNQWLHEIFFVCAPKIKCCHFITQHAISHNIPKHWEHFCPMLMAGNFEIHDETIVWKTAFFFSSVQNNLFGTLAWRRMLFNQSIVICLIWINHRNGALRFHRQLANVTIHFIYPYFIQCCAWCTNLCFKVPQYQSLSYFGCFFLLCRCCRQSQCALQWYVSISMPPILPFIYRLQSIWFWCALHEPPVTT